MPTGDPVGRIARARRLASVQAPDGRNVRERRFRSDTSHRGRRVGTNVTHLAGVDSAPDPDALIRVLDGPARLRGRYQSVFFLSWACAAALAPVLAGLVQQHLGPRWLWLGCAAIGAVISAGHALSRRARERRTAELRPTLPSGTSGTGTGLTRCPPCRFLA